MTEEENYNIIKNTKKNKSNSKSIEITNKVFL